MPFNFRRVYTAVVRPFIASLATVPTPFRGASTIHSAIQFMLYAN